MRNYVNGRELQKALDARRRREAGMMNRGCLVVLCAVYFFIGGFFGASICLLAEVMR